MAGPGTRGIFVSYRREDAGHVAGRLADRLAERFGASSVFIDVDSIEPGIDFAEAIQVAIARCDVLLALIGREWATMVDDRGRRRLDDPDDYVVLELTAALERNIRVIPVLVDGAEVPSQNSLAPSLRPLVRRNAVRLDYETFRSDAAWLAQRLGELLSATESGAAPAQEALPERTEWVDRTSSAQHAAAVEADPSTPSVRRATAEKPRLPLGSGIRWPRFLRWNFGANLGRATASYNEALRVRGGEPVVVAPPPAEPAGPPVPEERFLQGRFPERVRLGEEVTLLVRLGLQPGARLEAGLAPLAVPEAGLEVVLLLVDSPGFTLRSPERQVVRVVPRQDSGWAAFELQAAGDGVHTLRVEAFAGGTGLGGLGVQVSVDPAAQTGPSAEHASPAAVTPPGQGEVSLLLTYDADRQVYRYRLVDAGGYYSEEAATNRLLQPPGEAVEQLVAQLNALARGQAGWDAGTTRDWLQGQGIALWDSFIPHALQREFWQRRDRITQMTIVSDGDPVPWELLYPFAPGGQDVGFLVDQFPVARRRYGPRPPGRLDLAAADLVLSGDGLAAAPAEITALDALLRGRGLAPRRIGDLPALRQAFQQADVGLLHFSCHNAFARGAPNASRILLGGQPFEPVFLNAHAGRFAGPLVFLNACRTDGQAPLYTTVEGWAASFLRAGAGAFIGSLWEVTDTSAATYAQQFYQAALAGDTLGEAARQARDAIRDNPADPTWLAYTLYADPTATISTAPAAGT